MTLNQHHIMDAIYEHYSICVICEELKCNHRGKRKLPYYITKQFIRYVMDPRADFITWLENERIANENR